MSLHEAVTSLKRMFEASPVFKAAGPEDMDKRKSVMSSAKQKALAEGKVWCNVCEAVPTSLSCTYEWATENAKLKDGKFVDGYCGVDETGDRSATSCGECYEYDLENMDKVVW